jgi:hypothetical protein
MQSLGHAAAVDSSARQPGPGVVPGKPLQQVIDFAARRGRQRRARFAQGRRAEQPAPLQDVLAHRQADARLLLVAQQRQVGVEEVVRRFAFGRPADRRTTSTSMSGKA